MFCSDTDKHFTKIIVPIYASASRGAELTLSLILPGLELECHVFSLFSQDRGREWFTGA